MTIENEKKKIEELKGHLVHLEKLKAREEQELERVALELKHSQDAREVLQLMAQAVQQQAHAKISAVVSRCLSAVFDDPYQFQIQFEMKRGKTEASLRFVRRDLDVDPLSAAGGGVVDVASFALRVACLVLSRPRLSRVLVLDEPLKYVSAQYQENVRSMLEQLSKDMGIQIVMVTHVEGLATGEVVEL